MIEGFFDWLLRWGEVIGAIGSAIVMGTLAFLYYQQRKLLADTFYTNNRAKVEVEFAFPAENDIDVQLSNVGNGVATDLELVVLGIYTSKDEQLQHGLTINSLKRTDRGEPNTTGSLEAGEKETPYMGRISLHAIHGRDRTGFTTGVREMTREGISVCRVHLFVKYADFTETHRGVHVGGWEFEPTEGIETADECFEQGNQIWFEIPEYDPVTDEYDLSNIPTGKEKIVV